MIYLDNAATSFPKPDAVKKEMAECIAKWCGNPGRAGHRNAMLSSEAVYKARKKTAEITGFSPEEVIFTANCTAALNIGIKGTLNDNDHVVATVFEHNSVLRTLNALKAKGIETTLIGSDENGNIDPETFRKAIKNNTKLIVCTLASNVTGNIMPVYDISRIAKENGILFLLDASQGLGSIPLDMEKIRPDLLCSSGHKSLLGPQGTGFLCIRKEVEASPFIHGGTGTDSKNMRQPEERPEGFESGTVNVPGLAGLAAAIEYLQERGIDDIRKRETDLIGCLQEEIKSIENITLYGDKDPYKRSSILSFNIQDIDCEIVAEELDTKYGIAVRAGYHCSPLAHEAIGTKEKGCVRISVGPFNTYDDIIKTAEAIKIIAEKQAKKY